MIQFSTWFQTVNKCCCFVTISFSHNNSVTIDEVVKFVLTRFQNELILLHIWDALECKNSKLHYNYNPGNHTHTHISLTTVSVTHHRWISSQQGSKILLADIIMINISWMLAIVPRSSARDTSLNEGAVTEVYGYGTKQKLSFSLGQCRSVCH
jgi:hypothetical protein